MKKLLVMLLMMMVFTGCTAQEEEPETFEEFVDNEMIFSRSMETSNDMGIPNIKVEAEVENKKERPKGARPSRKTR